jgi:hypothetical protein
MKKTVVLSALVCLLVGPSVMAASLTAIPALTGQVSSEGRCITPDGLYVGGVSGTSTTTYNKGFVRADALNGGAPLQPVAGSAQTSVLGIGYRIPAGGGATELVIGGDNSGWQSMNASTDGGLTWTKRRRTSGTPTGYAGLAYGGGPGNTVCGTGTDIMFSTCQTPGSTTPTLYVDAWTGGSPGNWVRPPALQPDSKGTTTESNICGVSNAGVAVGRRKDAGGVFQNYVLTYDGDGGLAAAFTNGLDGTTHGSLWDIADNGSRAGGMSPVSGGRLGDWPYIRNMSSGAVTELPRLGGTYEAAGTMGIVYGMSPNGDYAVGMDYSYGNELAVLWDLRDANPANWTALNLTAFANSQGVLGAFSGNLRRAYAVGVDALGQPVVTGYGYAPTIQAGWTGYVMTVPEPTAVMLLALGGLLVMRRRR